MRGLFTAKAVAASALVTIALGACGSSSSSSSSPGATSSAQSATSTNAQSAGHKSIQLAYFAPVENGYIQAVLTGAKQGAASTGGEVAQTFAANGSDSTQIKQIQDAVASHKYKGLLIYPVDPSVAAAATDAIKAGVKVAIVETGISPDALKNVLLPGAVISTDEALQFRAAGLAQLIAQACANRDPCNVAYMLGLPQIPSEAQVFGRIKSLLASHPNVKIVATGSGQYATQPAETAAANILTAHPNLNVFATTDDDMTYGVQLAMQQAGKSGIKLIGVGASVRGCQSVKSGKWFGTTNSVPVEAGALAAKAIDQAITTGAYKGSAVWDPYTQEHLPLVTTQANAASCPGQWTT